jgi:uncharacterized protein (DUF433 family)
MTTISSSHVWIDDRHTAWIDQTNIKVIEIALERLAHGSSVEEIVDQHCGLISFAQVHAALAHYYDHQAEFDAEIDRQLKVADQLRRDSLSSPGRMRLRSMGRIP